MKLDLFSTLDDVSEDRLHPKFKFLRDSPLLRREREVLISWTEGFLDRDNKIVKEFQTTFHSSFWEFYLHEVFKTSGLRIDFSKDRPDFIIDSPFQLYSEAVVSNIKATGRKEKERGLDDILEVFNPPHLNDKYQALVNESIVRNSNALLNKSNKYTNSYVNLDWVDEGAPYAIALSSYDQINYGQEYYYAMMALLYGMYYNPATKKFKKISEIFKPDTDSVIPVGLFHNEAFSHVSAVIFSCTLTLGKLTSLANSLIEESGHMNQVINVRHDYEEPFYKIQKVCKSNPEELTDGLMVFHNHKAKNPLPLDVLENSNAMQFTYNDLGGKFEANNSPIVARLNLPKIYPIDPVIIDLSNRYNS